MSNKFNDKIKDLKSRDFIGIFEMSYHKDTRVAQKIFFKSYKNLKAYCFNANIYSPPRLSNLLFYRKNYKIIFHFPNLLQFFKILKIFFLTLNKVKNKKDLINFKFENIIIGDLIYDTIIRKHFVETVNLKKIKTKFEIFLCISKLIFWIEFLKKNKNKVKYICGSHSNYSIAIPLRVALKFNISVFILNIETIYKLNNQNKYVGLHYKDIHKKKYNKLKKKSKYLNLSKKEIDERFKEGKGFDLPPLFKNTFYKSNKLKLKIDKKKINCLIALHDFYDAPNSKGTFLFNDFYEWIVWLSKYSHKRKDINWYIKPHPSILYRNKQIEVCKKIITKFNNAYLLENNPSHKDLISKIDFALSCRGTIGYEYPYFNKPVIMASNKNNFIDYKFCYSASSIIEYKKYLDNIQSIITKFKVDKKEIYKFYLTQYFLYSSSTWIVKEYEKVYNTNFKRQDPKSSRLNNKTLIKYYNKINDDKFIESKAQIVRDFISSKEFKLTYNKFK